MLKKENEQENEKKICLKAKFEMQSIKDNLDKKTKEDTYLAICSCVNSYFAALLKENNFMTEHETIEKLKKFNLKKTSIDLADNIFKQIIQIEYNNYEYNKEDLFRIIIGFERMIDEINIQRTAYHLSVKDRLLLNSKNKLALAFESKLKALKSDYMKSGGVNHEKIEELTEYYSFLPDNKKEFFSKEYYYYCRTLPGLLILLTDIKNANTDVRKNQLGIEINKLFTKLDDSKKEEFFPRIINLFSSYEQKIDFLLLFGYSQVLSKKKKNAFYIYAAIFNNFKYLDNQNKKYYKPIILRFMNAVKTINK